MRVTIKQGTPPLASALATWADYFPYLIEYRQITRQDLFATQATGVISSGRPLPVPVDGSATYTNALSGGSMTVDTDATVTPSRKFLRATAAVSSGIVTDTGVANHRASIRARIVGSAAGVQGFGLLIRYVDVSNYLLVVVRKDLGTVQIQSRIAGSAGVLAQTAYTPVEGVDYVVTAKCVGDVITVHVKDITNDGTLATLTWTTSQFNTATKAGPYAVNPAGLSNRIYEFYGA